MKDGYSLGDSQKDGLEDGSRESRIDELARRALEGDLPLRKIGEALGVEDPNDIVAIRRRMVEIENGVDLSHIGGKLPDLRELRAQGVKDENHIGYIPLIVGITDPVDIAWARHLERKSLQYLLATTEAGLIAGSCLGAKVVNDSGGMRVESYRKTNRMARSSAFELSDPFLAQEYEQALHGLVPEFPDVINEGYGRYKGLGHAILKQVDITTVDGFLFIRYEIDPGDAAGHNMVTKAAHILNGFLVDRLADQGMTLDHLILSGGLCKDKNTAAVNWTRGIRFQANVVVPFDVCEKYGIEPEKTARACLAKNYIAQSIAGGMRGNNSSVSNPFTAFAIAYGQDPANVVEASQAMTIIRVKEAGLSYTVNGNAVCGTMGGGTVWPAQRQALELLGLYGSDPDDPGLYKARLGEVVAGAFLLSELAVHRSLMTGKYGPGSRHFEQHNGRFVTVVSPDQHRDS